MKKRIDLHLHTDKSDGLLTPAELLARVKDRGLAAFSVTDHDTIAGFLATRELIQEGDPELIPGVELSCTGTEHDMHLLAYMFDPDSPVLVKALEEFQEKRNHRGALIVQKLNEMGVELSYDLVVECAGGAAVGRPHVADALCRCGAVDQWEMAFQKYIGDRAPAFVPKANVRPEDAIDLIHRANGLAVLAHPMVGRVFHQLESLAAHGLDGVEAFHPDHRRSEEDRLVHDAERFHLLVTGGSDFHGRENNPGLIGSEPVTEYHLLKLKEAASRKRGLS